MCTRLVWLHQVWSSVLNHAAQPTGKDWPSQAPSWSMLPSLLAKIDPVRLRLDPCCPAYWQRLTQSGSVLIHAAQPTGKDWPSQALSWTMLPSLLAKFDPVRLCLEPCCPAYWQRLTQSGSVLNHAAQPTGKDWPSQALSWTMLPSLLAKTDPVRLCLEPCCPAYWQSLTQSGSVLNHSYLIQSEVTLSWITVFNHAALNYWHRD